MFVGPHVQADVRHDAMVVAGPAGPLGLAATVQATISERKAEKLGPHT
jgi:hypothetical protein